MCSVPAIDKRYKSLVARLNHAQVVRDSGFAFTGTGCKKYRTFSSRQHRQLCVFHVACQTLHSYSLRSTTSCMPYSSVPNVPSYQTNTAPPVCAKVAHGVLVAAFVASQSPYYMCKIYTGVYSTLAIPRDLRRCCPCKWVAADLSNISISRNDGRRGTAYSTSLQPIDLPIFSLQDHVQPASTDIQALHVDMSLRIHLPNTFLASRYTQRALRSIPTTHHTPNTAVHRRRELAMCSANDSQDD
jgi:hypothetical protein